MKILFDVGANYGIDSISRIENDHDSMCFAFEPTPQLVDHLRKKL